MHSRTLKKDFEVFTLARRSTAPTVIEALEHLRVVTLLAHAEHVTDIIPSKRTILSGINMRELAPYTKSAQDIATTLGVSASFATGKSRADTEGAFEALILDTLINPYDLAANFGENE